MFELFARSICTHCLPGPSSTQEPSSPALSPSVTRSSVPTTGLLSLAVTFLPLDRFTVPAGTRKSGRLPFIGGSRLGTLRGTGVPTKRGLGSWVFRGTLSCASAAHATRNAAETKRYLERVLLIVSSSHFFAGNLKSLLGGNGVVCSMHDVLAAERFIGRAIQLCRSADGVEEVFQVRLVRRFIEEHRDLVFRQLRGFTHVDLRGVCRPSLPGADVSLLDQVVPRDGVGASFTINRAN